MMRMQRVERAGSMGEQAYSLIGLNAASSKLVRVRDIEISSLFLAKDSQSRAFPVSTLPTLIWITTLRVVVIMSKHWILTQTACSIAPLPL